MKKVYLVLLLFLFSFVSSTKPLVEIKTTVKGYYHGLIDSTSLQNRTRFDLAKDDVQNYLIANGGGTGYVQAPYWQIDVTINDSDTIAIVKPFEPYFKDTTFYAKQINKIFDSKDSARYFNVMYKPDSSKRHVDAILISAKDSIPKPLNCTECGVKDIKIKFRTFYDTPEDVRRVELEHEYINKEIDLEPDFVIDSTFANIIEANRFNFQILSTKQNKITRFTLILESGNIVDYPQDSGFNATDLNNGLFRHGRFIDGLEPNTNYMFTVTLESEKGTVRKSEPVLFKTIQ